MERPLGVTILAVLNIVGGVIGVLTSVFLLGLFGLGGSAVDPDTGAAVAVGSIITLVIALAQIVIGIGLWQLWKPAWFAAAVIALVNFVNGFWQMVGGFQGSDGGDLAGGVVAVIISFAILYYLYRPEVKAVFR
jgi:hypothetical protein